MEYIAENQHAPAAEDDWGEDAHINEPTPQAKRSAVAPSVRAGQEKWKGRLARDSEQYICEIAWSRPRAFVTVGECEDVPAGFPELGEFWKNAKSVRMFNWGLGKYMQIFPEDAWVTGMGTRKQLSLDAAGDFRRLIHHAAKEKPLTRVQVGIVRSLVTRGIVKRVCTDAAELAPLRRLVNKQRLRKALLRCRFVVRLCRLAGVATGAEAAAAAAAPTQPVSGRVSPSLKRPRED